MDESAIESEYTGLAGCEGLDAALNRLAAISPPEPKELAKAARAVTGAADESELNALETRDRELRALMLRRVQEGRIAAHNARKKAREVAMKKARNALFTDEGDVDLSKNRFAKLLPADIVNEHRAKYANKSHDSSLTATTTTSAAQQINQDINDSLRRTSALVANEVERSRAAGNVVADSTRTLARTRDQYHKMSSSIKSGGKTLGRLSRTETRANVLIALSFAFFFIVVGYVVSYRLRHSLVTTVILRPTAAAVSYPIVALVKSARLVRNKIFSASGINLLKSMLLQNRVLNSIMSRSRKPPLPYSHKDKKHHPKHSSMKGVGKSNVASKSSKTAAHTNTGKEASSGTDDEL